MKMDEKCHLCGGKYGHVANHHMSFISDETGDVDYACVCAWCRFELKKKCEILTEVRFTCGTSALDVGP